MDDDLLWLDATAQAALVRNGEVSPSELVNASIDRIERINPQLNAVIHEQFEQARALAGSADLPEGPFRGVPMLFKDVFVRAGRRAVSPRDAGAEGCWVAQPG